MTKTEAAVREIARDVYKCLGSGHSESIYHCAMEVGLRLRKIKYESEKVVEVKYKGHYVGRGHPDLLVGSGDESIVVELKYVATVGASEEQQLRNYMKRLKVKEGLLINFPPPGKNVTEPDFQNVPLESLPQADSPDRSENG